MQSLYDSLELKDSEIYCQRAKEMYSSPEPLRTGLFTFSMSHTRLLGVFDPSMLGEEKLVANLKDIDRIRYVVTHTTAGNRLSHTTFHVSSMNDPGCTCLLFCFELLHCLELYCDFTPLVCSPFPPGPKYTFSTLLGGYVSGDSDHLEVS